MKTKMEQFPATNPNPVLSVEKDGTVLYSNEAGEPLLNEWGVGVGEKLPLQIENIVQKVISRNSPEKIEVEAGKRVYSVAFYLLPEEECVNIYGFDISNQKESVEKIHNSEEKYRTLFENMTEACFLAEIICDKDGKPYDYRHLEINAGYELNTGIKKEQLLGKSILEVFPNVNPVGIEKLGNVALSGESTHFDFFSELANQHFDVYAFSPEKGQFAVIFRDITERKRAEELLAYQANLLANISDVVYSTDDQLRLVSWNQAAEKVYGLKEEKVLGRNILEVTGSMFNPEMRAKLTVEL